MGVTKDGQDWYHAALLEKEKETETERERGDERPAKKQLKKKKKAKDKGQKAKGKQRRRCKGVTAKPGAPPMNFQYSFWSAPAPAVLLPGSAADSRSRPPTRS